MSRRGNIIAVIYVVYIISAFALVAAVYGGTLLIVSLFLISFILLGLVIFGALRSSSRKTQVAEPMVAPATRPIFDEKTTPKDVKSKATVLSCPDCGYKNPGDAVFCIECGRNLE